jgi:hypothetical protein
MTTERSHHLAAHPGLPPTGDPRAHPANPGRPRGRPSHYPTTPTTTAKSKPTPPLAQHGLRQPRPPGSDAGRRRAGLAQGRRPRQPRPSQPCGCLPHRRPPHPPGRTQWTRNPRTPDTHAGHRTPGHLDARTGHRTPDTGLGHQHADEGTAGIRTSGAAMPSGRALGHPTVFLWTAPAAPASSASRGAGTVADAR